MLSDSLSELNSTQALDRAKIPTAWADFKPYNLKDEQEFKKIIINK